MRIRCHHCRYLDYDFLNDNYEITSPTEHFCGLHGRRRVDPDGEQMNLDSHGSCGYSPRQRTVQLSLDFDNS